LEEFGGDGAKRRSRVRKARLPFLHQPLHLPHLALEEAVDADLAGVGVEGDGGEAGDEIGKRPKLAINSESYFRISLFIKNWCKPMKILPSSLV